MEGKIEIEANGNEINPMFESTTKSTSSVLDDHSYCWQKDSPKSLDCIDRRNFIEVLANKINELPPKNKLLKRKTLYDTNRCFTWRKLKTDAKMNLHTDIQSIEILMLYLH